jgi:hypothetical protein
MCYNIFIKTSFSAREYRLVYSFLKNFTFYEQITEDDVRSLMFCDFLNSDLVIILIIMIINYTITCTSAIELNSESE